MLVGTPCYLQQASWLLLEAGRGWPWEPILTCIRSRQLTWSRDLVNRKLLPHNHTPNITPAPSRLGNKRDTEGTEDA